MGEAAPGENQAVPALCTSERGDGRTPGQDERQHPMPHTNHLASGVTPGRITLPDGKTTRYTMDCDPTVERYLQEVSGQLNLDAAAAVPFLIAMGLHALLHHDAPAQPETVN